MIIDDFMDYDGVDAKNGISGVSMTKKKTHLFTLVEINNSFQFSCLRQHELKTELLMANAMLKIFYDTMDITMPMVIAVIVQ